jgi:hypothetical protein
MSAKQEKIEKSFRERIEDIRMDMVDRIEQLSKNIEVYKQAEDFENAMKCDIKRSTLLVTLERLDEALK